MTLQYVPIEYWAKADAKLAAMGLPELVDTYEGQVCETRRLAGLARLPDVLLQQEHHAVYARKALEELRRHGLPERVYRRCCRAWQYSDADWADTQRQIESWASEQEADAVPDERLLPGKASRHKAMVLEYYRWTTENSDWKEKELKEHFAKFFDCSVSTIEKDLAELRKLHRADPSEGIPPPPNRVKQSTNMMQIIDPKRNA